MLNKTQQEKQQQIYHFNLYGGLITPFFYIFMNSLFNEALRLLRDLAEHQNGAPLISNQEEYNKTMTEVWDFLEANET